MNPFRRSRGNTLLLVLLVIAVLSVLAGNLLWSSSARYHTTYQSASWQEALVAAEGGVNLAMAELRKRVRGGDGAAFQAPWQGGNPAAMAGTPVYDKRLLGGALDPAAAGFVFDPVADPGAAHPIGLSPAYPETGRALPLTLICAHAGEGNTQSWARVYVDVPGSPEPPAVDGTNFAVRPPNSIDDFMNESSDTLRYDARTYWWYRVRSCGVAGVSGPARPSVDSRDNLLRRFSFFTDWRTGLPLPPVVATPGGPSAPGPQVSRVVEAVARPLMGFRNAIMADKQIDLTSKNVLVDSYNSANGGYGVAYTTPGGTVTLTNVGTLGNIATNGALINAGNATVQGSAMTNDGHVNEAGNVAGSQASDFYQELTKVQPPRPGPATNFALDGLTLNGKPGAGTSGDITFDGAGNYDIATTTDRNAPTRVYLDGIDLTHVPSTVELKGAADGKTSTYVKVMVSGDIRVNGPKTNAASAIIVDPGVHAIFYVQGNVHLEGAGIANLNSTQSAENLLIDGVTPPAGAANATPPVIDIESTQDFSGIIYAPDHDLKLALKAVLLDANGVPIPLSSPTANNPNAKQINDLNKQIVNLNQDIAGNQQQYQQDLAKYQKNGDQGAYKKMQRDQAQIASDQAQIVTVQAQLKSLGSTFIPDTPAQANDHNKGYNGIYGAFVARTITVGSKTHVHYDEALRQAGPVNHYTIANWFEDTGSHVGK